MKSKYLFSGEQKITANTVINNYLWLFFLGVSNSCKSYQASVFNPNQYFWELDITADEVTSAINDGTYLYASLDDTTNIGAKITLSTRAVTYFIKNVAITEKAIDLVKYGSYIYFLTPGLESGINAKIVVYNASTRAFSEIVDLTTVFNAKKIDVDASGNLWVQSDLDGTPKITKVWYSGTWQFSTQILS